MGSNQRFLNRKVTESDVLFHKMTLAVMLKVNSRAAREEAETS